jgi:hypothetical protein
MNNSDPSLIPLQRANLCLDCEVITPAHMSCLACGSTALLSIARALSGPAYPGMACFENPCLANPTISEVRRKHGHHGTNFTHST